MTAAAAEASTVSSGNAADVAGAVGAVPAADALVLEKSLEALPVAVVASAVATLAVESSPSAGGTPPTRPA